MLKVLELFAGIGACSKALERLGIEHEIVDAVEIDKYAIKSFNAVHGTNFEPQDITKWDKDIQVDLIMHGSPCQDFSVAGRGAGGDKDSGTRSSLMYETLRIVEKVKPKVVIWENVKNLLSKKHRHNFDAYVKAMYDMGYNSYWQVLNAKDYGVPQNRERVFTISLAAGWSGEFTFPPKQELTKRLKDVLEDSVDEKYYLSDEQVSKIKFCKPSDGISKTIRASGRGSLDKHSWDIVLEPQTALMAVVNGYRIRKLTPLECWRLMGFSDEDFEKAQSAGVSNSQLYKQAGNSIVVDVLMAILNNLIGGKDDGTRGERDH